MNINRQPTGTPRGGQFAPGPHAESSSVYLDGSDDDAPLDAASLARQRFAARSAAVRRKVDALERALPAAMMAEVHEAFPDATAVTVEVKEGNDPGTVSVEVAEVERPDGNLAAEGLDEAYQGRFDAMSDRVAEAVMTAAEWQPEAWVGGTYRVDSDGIGSWST